MVNTTAASDVAYRAPMPRIKRTRASKSATATDSHVGMRVRLRRLTVRMSQEALGEAIGVTFQQIQKYERGTNRIGASRLHNIARVLTVPVSFFFEGAPTVESAPPPADAPPPDYVANYLASDEGQALTKAFMKISDFKVRRKVVELVTLLWESRNNV